MTIRFLRARSVLTPEALAASLGPSLRVSALPPGHARAWLDTPDRALQRAGLTLEVLVVSGAAEVELRRLGDGEVVGRVALRRPPRFAHDVPGGRLGDTVARHAGVRALLPLARRRARVTRLAILDAADKVVARIEADPPGRSRGALAWCRVLPVRGYDAAARAVTAAAMQALSAAQPAPADPLLDALARAGLPTAPPSRPRADITARTRTDVAVRRVLRVLLDELVSQVDGTVADVDSEYLHDLRVAHRRSRSLLRAFRDTMPAPRVARFSRELAWLGSVTGAVRDLDVWLLELEHRARGAPSVDRPGLHALADLVAERRTAARARLLRDLRGARFRRLCEDWARFLDTPVPTRPRTPAALHPIADGAGARIARAYRRARREGRAIDEASPDTALHELRKTCKRLRYLIDAFGDVLPKGKPKRPLKALRGLQDVLGTFQDRCVQREALAELAAALPPGAACVAAPAVAWLDEILAAEQAAARAAFHARFAPFASAANRAYFRALRRHHARDRQASHHE